MEPMKSGALTWTANALRMRSVRVAVPVVLAAALLIWLSVRRPSSLYVSPDGCVTVRVVSPSFLVDARCFFANWSTSLADIDVYVVDNVTGDCIERVYHQPPDPWDDGMIDTIRIAWHADSRRFLCVCKSCDRPVVSWCMPLVGLEVKYDPFRVERTECSDWAAEAVRREFSGDGAWEREMREVLLGALSDLPEEDW